LLQAVHSGNIAALEDREAVKSTLTPILSDTTGDIALRANGGVIVKSYTPGGPTRASTFVAQNAGAHTYRLLISASRKTPLTCASECNHCFFSCVLSSSQSPASGEYR
jgi:hypothetical protein